MITRRTFKAMLSALPALGLLGATAAAFLNGEINAYSASTADTAILNQRGMAVRDITPAEFGRFFGNGIATMGETIRSDRELVEAWSRAFACGHAFALDDVRCTLDLSTLRPLTLGRTGRHGDKQSQRRVRAERGREQTGSTIAG